MASWQSGMCFSRMSFPAKLWRQHSQKSMWCSFAPWLRSSTSGWAQVVVVDILKVDDGLTSVGGSR